MDMGVYALQTQSGHEQPDCSECMCIRMHLDGKTGPGTAVSGPAERAGCVCDNCIHLLLRWTAFEYYNCILSSDFPARALDRPRASPQSLDSGGRLNRVR